MEIEDIYRPEVPTCGPETRLGEVARIMHEADSGMVAVVDGGKLVGVISERDLVRAVALREDARDVRVSEYATMEVVTATLGDDIPDIARTMVGHGIRHLPVVTTNGDLVGVVSMRDVFAVETLLSDEDPRA